jgi:hypothetical protein
MNIFVRREEIRSGNSAMQLRQKRRVNSRVMDFLLERKINLSGSEYDLMPAEKRSRVNAVEVQALPATVAGDSSVTIPRCVHLVSKRLGVTWPFLF